MRDKKQSEKKTRSVIASTIQNEKSKEVTSVEETMQEELHNDLAQQEVEPETNPIQLTQIFKLNNDAKNVLRSVLKPQAALVEDYGPSKHQKLSHIDGASKVSENLEPQNNKSNSIVDATITVREGEEEEEDVLK